MKKLTIIFLLVLLFLVVLQTIEKSGAPYIPILWVCIHILPVLYLLIAKAAKHNLIYLLGYALLVLVTLLATRFMLMTFSIESDNYLVVSSGWLLFGQLGVWAQYYFTRHRVAADALSLGIDFPPEKSARIRALLTDGRIEAAVEELTVGDELNQEQKVVVVNFAFRFAELSKKESMGLLTSEEAAVEKTRIVTGILRFV